MNQKISQNSNTFIHQHPVILWSGILTLVTLVCLLSLAMLHANSLTNQGNYQKQNEAVGVAESKYYEKQNKLLDKINTNAATSKDPKIRAWGQNRDLLSGISPNINQFLKIFYTFNNANDYNKRAKYARKIATPQVTDSKLFSGTTTIEAYNLRGEYDTDNITVQSANKNNIHALVLAVYKSWSADSYEHQSEYSAPEGETWFAMNISPKTKKITQVHKLYTDKNIHNTNQGE